jgi:hypothetical protein
VQVTSSRDWQKASASSATSGASEKSAEDSNGCQKADQADAPADAHADDLPAFPTSAHHPAGIPGIRNGQNYKNNNGLADLGADNADDADDSRPSRVCPNGYHAASATPEGRVCTVEILEINLVDSTRPVLGPPGDSLEDLRA